MITPSGASGTGLANYTISYVNGSLTVNPAPLTITATNRSKTSGTTYTPDTTPPSVDFTTTGLVNSDTVTRHVDSPGTWWRGGWELHGHSGASQWHGLSNYTISYVNGSFTVVFGTATVVANGSATSGTTVTTGSFTLKANTTYLVFAFAHSWAGDSATFSSTGLGSPTFNTSGRGRALQGNRSNNIDHEFGRYLNGGGSTRPERSRSPSRTPSPRPMSRSSSSAATTRQPRSRRARTRAPERPAHVQPVHSQPAGGAGSRHQLRRILPQHEEDLGGTIPVEHAGSHDSLLRDTSPRRARRPRPSKDTPSQNESFAERQPQPLGDDRGRNQAPVRQPSHRQHSISA